MPDKVEERHVLAALQLFKEVPLGSGKGRAGNLVKTLVSSWVKQKMAEARNPQDRGYSPEERPNVVALVTLGATVEGIVKARNGGLSWEEITSMVNGNKFRAVKSFRNRHLDENENYKFSLLEAKQIVEQHGNQLLPVNQTIG